MVAAKEDLHYEFHKPRYLRYYRQEAPAAVLRFRELCEYLMDMDVEEIARKYKDIYRWEKCVDYELEKLEWLEQKLAATSIDDLNGLQEIYCDAWHQLRMLFIGKRYRAVDGRETSLRD